MTLSSAAPHSLDAVFVELEGVLVDTHTARVEAMAVSLADDGICLTRTRCAERIAGLPVRLAVDAALSAVADGALVDDTARELLALRAERRMMERISGTGVVLQPGARELLEHLGAHVPVALVTRASRRLADFIVGLAGIEALLSFVVTADDRVAAKPSPAPYRLALTRLAARRAVRLSHVVALEDGALGLLSARAAGLCGVLIGEQPTAGTRGETLPGVEGVTLDDLARHAAFARSGGGGGALPTPMPRRTSGPYAVAASPRSSGECEL